jgi:hypothetical protein
MDDEVKTKRRYGRTAPVEPADGPTSNPDADELAALRKEKADRAAADQAAKEKEIEELRAYKAEQEKKATIKAPEKKAEKTVTTTATTTPVTATEKKRRRMWWSDES